MKFCTVCNNAYDITKNIQNKPEEDIGKNYYYFLCKNCNNFEKIGNKTIIMTRTKNHKKTNISDDKIKRMIHDETVPHTRNYVCPNKSCKSHDNYELRDAVFFKPYMDSYVTLTVCTVCQTKW